MASPRQLQFWLAMRGVQEGLTGASVLRTFREFGLGMRTQEFYRMWGEAATVVREAGAEPTRDLTQVPSGSEAPPVPAGPHAEPGIIQTVRLVYSEKETGNHRIVYHSTKSPAGVTRQQAINNAIDAYAAHSEEYQTTLLYAAHSSAITIVPMEAAA
jgi:hypothetical protein